jgi:cysteine synthase
VTGHLLSSTSNSISVEGIGYDFIPDALSREPLDIRIKTDDNEALGGAQMAAEKQRGSTSCRKHGRVVVVLLLEFEFLLMLWNLQGAV